MASATIRQQAKDSTLRQMDGASIGAMHLRLGKLRQPSEEELVIEEADDMLSTPWTSESKASPSQTPRGWRLRRMPEAVNDVEVVEQDMLLEECSSDDEPSSSSSSFPACWAPGSVEGRRLMMRRAQQCVVCMEEKEHTFVPRHLQDAGQNVNGHRFCTDCWQEFLQHGLQRCTAAPLPLSCPVCRSTIAVPDCWGVDIDLPAAWTQAPGVEDDTLQSPTASFGQSTLDYWADVLDGATTISTDQEHDSATEECSPMVQFRESHPSRCTRSRPATPVPGSRSQTGTYIRRLFDIFAGSTAEHSIRSGERSWAYVQ